MSGTMWICGLSMEMELAEEMGWVGKCIGCHYLEKRTQSDWCGKKKESLVNHKENCELWLVDHR